MNPPIWCWVLVGMGVGFPVGAVVAHFMEKSQSLMRVERFRMAAVDAIHDGIAEGQIAYETAKGTPRIAELGNSHMHAAGWCGAAKAALLVSRLEAL